MSGEIESNNEIDLMIIKTVEDLIKLQELDKNDELKCELEVNSGLNYATIFHNGNGVTHILYTPPVLHNLQNCYEVTIKPEVGVTVRREILSRDWTERETLTSSHHDFERRTMLTNLNYLLENDESEIYFMDKSLQDLTDLGINFDDTAISLKLEKNRKLRKSAANILGATSLITAGVVNSLSIVQALNSIPSTLSLFLPRFRR